MSLTVIVVVVVVVVVEGGVVVEEVGVVVAPGASLEGGLEKGLVVGWRGRVYCLIWGGVSVCCMYAGMCVCMYGCMDGVEGMIKQGEGKETVEKLRRETYG
jgi:hypothetical protein